MSGNDGLPDRLQRWWPLVRRVEARLGVERYLIAAVMDRESLCGEALSPKGPEGTGDGGHGRGLMQIDDRWHKPFIAEKLEDGSPAWRDAASNITYGAQLLQRNIVLFNGDEACAVGAYNAGPAAVRRALRKAGLPRDAEAIIAAVDSVTTGRNYVSDVLSRRNRFRRLHLGAIA